MAITLNDCQKKAINALLQFLVDPKQFEFVLEGYAGTGKTTMISHFIDNYDKYKKSMEMLGASFPEFREIAITATTRKAASVLAQTMNVDPITIHSYLGLVLKNDYNTGETKLTVSKSARVTENCLIIIDEASFIDPKLKQYIKNMTRNCKIIYMGDPCQLISVNTDKSPIFGVGLPTVRLTTIERNKGTISDLSAMYRDTVESGVFKPVFEDGNTVRIVDPDTFQNEIEASFSNKSFIPDSSAKVLAWTNDRVNVYNNFIRECKGITDPINEGETLITNKPIMQPQSEEIAYSTDRPVKIVKAEAMTQLGVQGYSVTLRGGLPLFVPTERWKVKMILKKLASQRRWDEYFDIKNHWGDLRPVYASTVHKSQGSTYDKVFIDLSDIGSCKEPEDTARLLYVATSRPSKEIVMCGELPPHYMGEANAPESNAA